MKTVAALVGVEIKPEYYDLHNLLSRNGVFNFVVGMRGNGKTYAFKHWAIRDYIKNGNEFIYLRRYDTELADRHEFFKDIAHEFPDYEFRIEGYKAQIRKASELEKNPHEWKTCGYLIKLSNAVTKKSVPYPKVTKIGFDEFILESGHVHYLPNEVRAFQDFYNTVDRWQDRVRVVFMANSVSIVNPYFIAYNIIPKKGQAFTTLKDGFIVVEYVKSDAFRNRVKQTRFGRMISDTAYGAFALDNVFKDDHNTFVKAKPSSAEFHYGITFAGRTVGIWVDYNAGEYFVSKRCVEDGRIFVLSKADMQPNLIMLEKSSQIIKSLRNLYMQGSVFFDSPQTREQMNTVFNFLNLR